MSEPRLNGSKDLHDKEPKTQSWKSHNQENQNSDNGAKPMTAGILFENFDLLAEAPNGVKRLRELVLDLAFQGRLVRHDPRDAPASALLQEMRTEKERLIKRKEIKR